MKKLLFFLIFLLLLNNSIFSIIILLESNIYKEGDVIKIIIKSENILTAGSIEFLNQNFPLFFVEFNNIERLYIYSALIPIPLNTLGSKDIIIKIKSKSGVIEKKEKIKVKKLKFYLSNIKTSKINKEIINELNKNNKIIDNLQTTITPARFIMPFIMPVQGIITTNFGAIRKYNNKMAVWRHKGIDIAAEKGTPVRAANNGIIAGAYFLNTHGNFIIINHGIGIYSLYLHLDKVYVKVGQKVLKNDIIGTVGDSGIATGPHLHWQINIFKIPVNPLNFLN